jgi:hypothetical protein
MEKEVKVRKFIYRFFHPLSRAKLNLFASTDEEAIRLFGLIVQNVIEWKLKKPAKSSKRNKQQPK